MSHLSWGTRKVVLDDQAYEAPSLIRKKPVSVMFDEYCGHLGDTTLISRSSFYRLCERLAKGQTEARKSVDYVTGFLVNDTLLYWLLKSCLSKLNLFVSSWES